MDTEFKIPEFMKNESVEDILSRMFAALPETISKEENGWVSDLFLPVAIEQARMVEFVLLEAIKNIIPKYSYGDILLGHAENRKIERKAASYAKVILTVQGICNTIIPKGFVFSTVSTADSPGILFNTNEEYTIPENREIDIYATCINKGIEGNVAAETIILMLKPAEGIKSVVNKNPAYDSFDEESEESLRKRIAEYDLMQGVSFIGSSSDYRRWAMEVEGVGNAEILSSYDDTGTVTIILTDINGQPVSDNVCGDVYNYIMRPDSPYDRLAPVNALLNVVSAIPLNICINADIDLKEGFTIDMVKPIFIENLKQYLMTASAQLEVKYTEIGAVLINTNGISDYKDFLLNNKTSNIKIELGFVPVISDDSVVLV